MSTAYTQQKRLLKVNTPLGDDVLLMVGFNGQEGISELFQYNLHVVAPNDQADKVTFDKLLGQSITLSMAKADQSPRFFNGICNQVSQGTSDAEFTEFHLEVVPKFWLWTRRQQSRIFQHVNVKDILKKVLDGLEVKYQLEGNYEKRDFCVQYRETDFAFASRLMEEEGIYYYFKHDNGNHQMVVADSPGGHDTLPSDSTITLRKLPESVLTEDIIFDWTKTQRITSGKTTLWDYRFEMPRKHLEAEEKIQPNAEFGQESHKLQVANNNELEVYDWPGEYAKRFDGVDKGGGDQDAELQKVFQDNTRTTALRMEETAAGGSQISGAGNCRQMVTGHTFTVKTLSNDTLTSHLDANGKYVLTRITHSATNSGYRSGGEGSPNYSNTFQCLPASIPFRPQRTTRKPTVSGTQTAHIVGPDGEEIFTDKYGRVKVQFHWDREGKYDADSSCWIRVAQVWAGKRWGASFWPRIGQEVIVDFLEGDPDQPIIVGSVYNKNQMPPYLGEGLDDQHKNDNKVSGIKTNTTTGGDGFNEIRFDDNKDKEQIFVHCENDWDHRVKSEYRERIFGNQHSIVGWEKDGDKGGDQRVKVYQDVHRNIKRNQIEHIEGNTQLLVGKGEADDGGNVDIVIEKTKKEKIEEDNHITVVGNRNENVQSTQSLTVGGDQQEKVGMNHALDAGNEIHLKAGMTVVIEAGMDLTIKGAGGFIKIGPDGVTIQGTMVKINCGGSPGSGSGSEPTKPEAPEEADPTEPSMADDSVTGFKSAPE